MGIWKRFFAVVLIVVVVLSISATTVLAEQKSSAFTGRNGFRWGITGHNEGYEAYPSKYLQQQIKLTAELGVKYYRFNCMATSLSQLQYLDKVVEMCTAYGIEVFLVMDGELGDEAVIESNAKMIASRYKGKINYVQALNELDLSCILGAHVDGSQASDYNVTTLAKKTKSLKAMIKGLRAGNPNVKTVVNFAYKHTGYIDYITAHGVEFDIIGWDWYANMEPKQSEDTMADAMLILDKICTSYSQAEVMICETNTFPQSLTSTTETDRTKFLTNFMRKVYDYNSPKIMGFTIYELLDEPSLNPDVPFVEKNLGLVQCGAGGVIGQLKPAYYKIQELLGGSSMDHIKLPVTSSSSSSISVLTSNSKTATSAVVTTQSSSQSSSIASTTKNTSSSTTTSVVTKADTKPIPKSGIPIWVFIIIGTIVLAAIGYAVYIILKKTGKI